MDIGEKMMSNSEPKKQINACTFEWEELMIEELAKKHKISEDIVLDIGITFLLNETKAITNGKDCILSSMHQKN